MASVAFSRPRFREKNVCSKLTSWNMVEREFHIGHSSSKSMLVFCRHSVPLGHVDIFPRGPVWWGLGSNWYWQMPIHLLIDYPCCFVFKCQLFERDNCPRLWMFLLLWKHLKGFVQEETTDIHSAQLTPASTTFSARHTQFIFQGFPFIKIYSKMVNV